MTLAPPPVLLVGEIFVDVTITPRGEENKMRLGGIVHAARGLWSMGVPFSVAAVVPAYLEDSARAYLEKFGCVKFGVFGYVRGAPNIGLIFDPTEVDDQGYEFLLRDEKKISNGHDINGSDFHDCRDVLLFPGTFDLAQVSRVVPTGARLHVDVAYDIQSVDDLSHLRASIKTVFISTSSQLFLTIAATGIRELASHFSGLNLEAIILKENRGGSRLWTYADNHAIHIPAQLGITVNSVGVGDVYDAAYVVFRQCGLRVAGWRAAMASASYSQTTEPDILERYVRRDLRLSESEMTSLGGTSLSWESRQTKQIYLAAPDFKQSDRRSIERAVSALKYHNFKVRRPVEENGELPPATDYSVLKVTYEQDVALMKQCDLVFAIPTDRDPGTLVEVGLAIQMGIPVVVYDPKEECANTMVIAGSRYYSPDLDGCLNAVFAALSEGPANE